MLSIVDLSIEHFNFVLLHVQPPSCLTSQMGYGCLPSNQGLFAQIYPHFLFAFLKVLKKS